MASTRTEASRTTETALDPALIPTLIPALIPPLIPTWAVVPVNSLSRGKSRLSPVLSRSKREAFTLQTLDRTLGLLATVPSIEAVVVVSPDEEVRGCAARRGAAVLRDVGGDLNGALEEATAWALAEEAERLLILAVDLPLLARDDLERLLRSDGAPSVAIAPCKDGSGTNALAVHPPGLFRSTFGAGSFSAHRHAAQEAGARVRIVRSKTLELDIDTPLDYANLLERIEKANRES